MRLDQIAGVAVDHLFGRMLRRAALVSVIAVFAIVAVYHFATAGTMALETHYGALHAQLIMGGVYTALSAITFAAFWATRAKSTGAAAPALAAPREMQIAMLVEAVMLGYSLAHKGEQAR
jgi:hypothetical protein